MKNLSLTRWFNRQKSSTTSNTGSPAKNYADIRILIVDDSRTQLYAMERMLQSVGIKTITAENGKQGILMARHQKPDLILMDIVMPDFRQLVTLHVSQIQGIFRSLLLVVLIRNPIRPGA